MKSFLILFFVFIYNMIISQEIPNKKQSEELINSKIYIVVPPTYQEYISFLEKKGLNINEKRKEAEKIKFQKNDEYVKTLREIVEENWTLNNNIEIINLFEKIELFKINNPQTKGGKPISLLEFNINIKGFQSYEENNNVRFPNIITVYRLSQKKTISYNTYLHEGDLDFGEILLGFLNIQNYIKFCSQGLDENEMIDNQIDKNFEEIKKRTLFVFDEDLNNSLTLTQIKEVYPYEVEIVNRDELNEILINKDDSKLVLMIFNKNNEEIFQSILLPENGEIANIIQNKKKLTDNNLNLEIIQKEHFELFLKKTLSR